jgi:1,4-alpha-glucan branching enzyme
LQLANELVRQVNKNAITIAEDTSALPGLALPISYGGIGFDYRLAMGEPDMWIRLLKETPDEYWDLNSIYYELAVRRPGEPVIGYCESHDQALVGDKTIMFRLCDQEMYWGMSTQTDNMVVDRGMALHKMLRLITVTLGGEGYLTFMGNEFGHPEWIDFPREGNGWSYHYCRRQWSLSDREDLKYKYLRAFDKAMVEMVQKARLQKTGDKQLYLNNDSKVLCFRKGKKLFVFNFHPNGSYPGYRIPMDKAGAYQVSLSTDDYCFGGQGRIHHNRYETKTDGAGNPYLELYIPARTAIVLDEK